MTELEQTYQKTLGQPSDIRAHLPLLFRLASRSRSAAELGVRYGTSATAIVAGVAAGGQAGASFLGVDTAPWIDLGWLAQLAGGRVAVRFARADSRTVDLSEVDLLHIDTLHTADQLFSELSRHYRRVRKFIALHDTETYGTRGEDGGPGLLSAIAAFLNHQPHWRIVKRCRRQNGMVVLGRRP